MTVVGNFGGKHTSTSATQHYVGHTSPSHQERQATGLGCRKNAHTQTHADLLSGPSLLRVLLEQLQHKVLRGVAHVLPWLLLKRHLAAEHRNDTTSRISIHPRTSSHEKPKKISNQNVRTQTTQAEDQHIPPPKKISSPFSQDTRLRLALIAFLEALR